MSHCSARCNCAICTETIRKSFEQNTQWLAIKFLSVLLSPANTCVCCSLRQYVLMDYTEWSTYPLYGPCLKSGCWFYRKLRNCYNCWKKKRFEREALHKISGFLRMLVRSCHWVMNDQLLKVLQLLNIWDEYGQWWRKKKGLPKLFK